jgi:hypothetical protein
MKRALEDDLKDQNTLVCLYCETWCSMKKYRYPISCTGKCVSVFVVMSENTFYSWIR